MLGLEVGLMGEVGAGFHIVADAFVPPGIGRIGLQVAAELILQAGLAGHRGVAVPEGSRRDDGHARQ